MTVSTADAWEPNGLPRGLTLSDFDGFCLSPVRETGDGDVTVCRPHEADFWSVYGFHRDAEEWQIVHDAEARDMGEALARIAEITFQRIEYRDPDHAYANTTLLDLSALLRKRIEEIAADDPHWIPLHDLRQNIDLALLAREG
jgi:hypothetical protein